MAENSKIEWTDHTFNPWRGCTKVSAGCANCYAEKLSGRNPGTLGQWGPNGTRVVATESYWKLPVKWNKQELVQCDDPACCRRWDCEGRGEDFCPSCGNPTADAARPRVFCASLADVFEDWHGPMLNAKGVRISHVEGACEIVETMDSVRRRLFKLIDATPNLDWLILTKRPENIRRMWCSHVNTDGRPPSALYRKNVWLLTSIENQETADERIPHLLKCRDLCPVLGLSCEPLLGPVDLSPYLPQRTVHGQLIGVSYLDPPSVEHFVPNVDWVIVGGESGPNARPMHPDWARSIRDQCVAAGVPFFFKQWGEHLPLDQWHHVGEPLKSARHGDYPESVVPNMRGTIIRVGKKAAGRLLDGREWNEFPKPVSV